jgi:hypothetical protein
MIQLFEKFDKLKRLILSALLLSAVLPCVSFSAEFLVMAKNNWMVNISTVGQSAEWITEREKQYRIGDIVQVFPDGKLSDYANADGKFYVVRVTGLSYEGALKYSGQWDETYIVNGSIRTRMVNRRVYRIRAEDLPTSVKTTLKNTHVYNTTLSEVRTYIRNKVTGLNE